MQPLRQFIDFRHLLQSLRQFIDFIDSVSQAFYKTLQCSHASSSALSRFLNRIQLHSLEANVRDARAVSQTTSSGTWHSWATNSQTGTEMLTGLLVYTLLIILCRWASHDTSPAYSPMTMPRYFPCIKLDILPCHARLPQDNTAGPDLVGGPLSCKGCLLNLRLEV